jgi:hypothetical protein
MELLNIGCGSDPWGDVRVDVAFSFITASFKPNVLADVHYLPFKSGAFKVAKASHVLERLRVLIMVKIHFLRLQTCVVQVGFSF